MIKNTPNLNLVIEYRSNINHKIVSQSPAMVTTTGIWLFPFEGNPGKTMKGLRGGGGGGGVCVYLCVWEGRGVLAKHEIMPSLSRPPVRTSRFI